MQFDNHSPRLCTCMSTLLLPRAYICISGMFLFANNFQSLQCCLGLTSLCQNFVSRPFPESLFTVKIIQYQVWWIKWIIIVLPHGVKTMRCISTGTQEQTMHENHGWSFIKPGTSRWECGDMYTYCLSFCEKGPRMLYHILVDPPD